MCSRGIVLIFEAPREQRAVSLALALAKRLVLSPKSLTKSQDIEATPIWGKGQVHDFFCYTSAQNTYTQLVQIASRDEQIRTVDRATLKSSQFFLFK